MEKFHYSLYGKNFTLVSIYKKHMVDISPRVQRLVVRSFPYQPFTVTYKKGSLIPVADALSRVTPMDPEDNIQLPIIAVNMITTHVLMCADSLNSFSTILDRIRKSMKQDEEHNWLSCDITEGFLSDEKLAIWSSTILVVQGSAIHQIRPHYLQGQNHSTKGDDTRDAVVHTWRPPRERTLLA